MARGKFLRTLPLSLKPVNGERPKSLKLQKISYEAKRRMECMSRIFGLSYIVGP
jgi:hypothetical protein